jgi:hypothetical protein
MIRSVAAVAVLALVFTACGGGSGPGSTPEDTFHAVKKAFAAKDFSAIVDLMPPSKLAEAEAEFDKNMSGPMAEGLAGVLGKDAEEVRKMGYKEFSAAMLAKMVEKSPEEFASMQDSEIISSKIDGDRATLKIKTGDEEQTVEFQKENGLWYWGDLD